jgi:hypothetical protein
MLTLVGKRNIKEQPDQKPVKVWTIFGRRALVTVGYGAALGTLILGVGGRIAMRVIAMATSGATGVSFGGTLTVVFLGAASGAAAGAILSVTRALLRRWPAAQAITFGLLLIAIALRGLRPLDTLRVALFLPLVVLVGILLQIVTRERPTAPA